MAITCPACETSNPDGARFCLNCGAKLPLVCPQCGAETPAGAKFCGNCGFKLGAAAESARPPAASTNELDRFIPRELLGKLEAARAAGQMVGERRIVTMLFCDVKGSTAAAARLDPEEWAEIINGAFAHMIAPIYHYEISERFTDKIAEFHRYALRLLETPVGAIGGGSAWADLGWCALTLGDTELADELFGKGLNHPTMMMMMERPRHLAGAAAVYLARGARGEALRLAEEACAYAEKYGMRHHYPLTRLVLGRALAADERHEAALIAFGQAASASREMGFRPILWQARAATARSLSALGRAIEAAAAENEAAVVAETIATQFSDTELRAEFRRSVARRLARLAGSPPPATSR